MSTRRILLAWVLTASLYAPEVISQERGPKQLTDKTLVVWVAPGNLDQQGGSALTLDDGFGHFDAIVFGERLKGRWMAGSDLFKRTATDQSGYPVETAGPDTFVQVAIVYQGKTISLYRNGQPYASYPIAERQPFTENSSIVFGRRHLDMQGTGFFTGKISDARIYARALTPGEIGALVPDEIQGEQPWAWWPFSSGRMQDAAGRFPGIRISGDIRIEDGCLVLGDRNATLVASAEGLDQKSVPSKLLPDNQPVPKRVIQTTREFRERLLSDPYRPAYHFCIPEGNGMPGDPNGAFFHQGRYHLMYLYDRENSGFSWGHISSTDLVHWRNHPDAIGPGDGDEGCFSGGAFVTPEGKAYLTYWELWGARGIGMAESTDKNFDRWMKFRENPVIPSTEWGVTEMKKKKSEGGEEREEGEERVRRVKSEKMVKNDVVFGSADPSNIWVNNGRYYMLTGNLLVLNKYGREPGAPADMQGDRTYLFVSDDLKSWEYLHPFYESNRSWTDQSEDNMCPSFLPLPTGPDGGPFSGKHLMLFISHNKGCQYYTGTYGNDHFIPEKHGRMTWVDNGYFAPEALVDDRGRQIMWAWIFDDRPDSLKNQTGWTGTYGLPRSLWLGPDGDLCMQPVKELASLRQNERIKKEFTVRAGTEFNLDEFGTGLMEIELTLEPGSASKVGISVGCSGDGREQTTIFHDPAARQLVFDATRSGLEFGRRNIEKAPFELKKAEPLVLRIFVDRSVTEVFANDRQAIARAVYPSLGGTGIRLFAEGGDVRVISFKAWEMSPSNSY
jgi:beta-fructofuranosidase